MHSEIKWELSECQSRKKSLRESTQGEMRLKRGGLDLFLPETPLTPMTVTSYF